MKFSFITLYIKDMERSLAFYNGLLGLDIKQRHPIQDGEIVFLGSDDGAQIELIYSAGFAGNTYTGFSLGFVVDSLEEATAKLAAAGHPVLRGPVSPTPDSAFSFFGDPDGIEVELIEYK